VGKMLELEEDYPDSQQL
jgi:hypothetical protein